MPRCSAELIRGLDLARCGERRLVSAAASQGKGHVAHRLERTGQSAQLRVFYLVRTTHTKIVPVHMSLNIWTTEVQKHFKLLAVTHFYGHID